MADHGHERKDPGAIRPHAHMDEVTRGRETPPERRAGPGEAAGPDRETATIVPLENRAEPAPEPRRQSVSDPGRDPADVRAGPGDAGRQSRPATLPDTGRRRKSRRAVALAIGLFLLLVLASVLMGLAA
ncbi:hypothetical protein [Histidinibacterium lentulum]|uniref:Uncharacterized protein n=1 Tax=Histidinibacterium lentulum TaxID=2480588 RepID=A0A3N2R8L5_9RHOB|nr:hypothetical protein [Histidinibacterium lentulum]ROU03753.1 hypothetical protein EAT49_05525 [Histidinibacterium lentulum]